MATKYTEVRAVSWQNRGVRDVLDSRLASDTGRTRVHLLRDPMRWDGVEWSVFARRRTVCGLSLPPDDEIMSIRAYGSDSDTTCGTCARAAIDNAKAAVKGGA